jgi:hypothetical protein
VRHAVGVVSCCSFGDCGCCWLILCTATAFRQLFVDVESLLGSRVNSLLGVWVKRAELWAISPLDRASLRKGALQQLTTWGPPNAQDYENDYAYKVGCFPAT